MTNRLWNWLLNDLVIHKLIPHDKRLCWLWAIGFSVIGISALLTFALIKLIVKSDRLSYTFDSPDF